MYSVRCPTSPAVRGSCTSAANRRLRCTTPAPATRFARKVDAPRYQSHVARASRNGGGSGFSSGFILGGIIFGTLGFLFAPQISRALLGEDGKLKLPFQEEEDLEVTREGLSTKIAQLNSAIDDVSAQLKASRAAADAVSKGDA